MRVMSAKTPEGGDGQSAGPREGKTKARPTGTEATVGAGGPTDDDLATGETLAGGQATGSDPGQKPAPNASVATGKTLAAPGPELASNDTVAAPVPTDAAHVRAEDRGQGGERRNAPQAKTAHDASIFARGTTLGRYVVLDILGSGGMGEVYTAYDPELDRKVALKVIRPALARTAASSTARARLLREAQAMAKLSHPNVIPVFDVGTVDGDVYVAMEYVEGKDVRAWLEAKERSYAEVLEIFSAAGRGLAAAHEQGLIHRDFKPDNVLLGDDGRVRVIDFGLARREAYASAAEESPPVELARARQPTDETTTQAGAMMGTPAYMAPEQIAGAATDSRTDQYNFAASLYEGLFGQLPFSSESLAELASRNEPRPPPEASGVPAWLAAALNRGLEPDPDRRFASMDEFLAAITPPRPRRLGWIAAAAAFAALGGAGVVGAVMVAGDEPCRDLGRELEGIWDDERRHAVKSVLLEIDAPHAEAVWENVETTLDDYAEAWIRTREDACRATAIDGTQSEDLLVRRMACLDRRRHELDAIVTVMLGDGEGILDNAAQAAGSLSLISDCSATTSLMAAPTPAENPHLDELIARARALDAAGSYAESHEVASRAAAEARAAEAEVYKAQSLHALGRAERRLGKADDALETSFAAVRAAARVGDPALEAKAWLEVAHVTLADLGRRAEAGRWTRHAEVALESAGGNLALEAVHRQVEANVLFQKRRNEEALASYRAAAALYARAHGEDHWRVAMVRRMIGAVLRRKGRYEDAASKQEQALAGFEAELGAKHPEITLALESLGHSQGRLGLVDDAKAAYERALSLSRTTLGEDHPRVARNLVSLGSLHRRYGRYEQAEDYIEQALQIRRKSLASDHPQIAATTLRLARKRLLLGEIDDALVLRREALGLRETIFGSEDSRTAGSRSLYCDALRMKMRLAEARRQCEQAVSYLEDADSPGSLASALYHLGLVDLEAGAVSAAVERLERAYELRLEASDPARARETAETAFALARARAAAAPQSAAATELGESARERFAALPPGERKRLPELEAWLDERRDQSDD